MFRLGKLILISVVLILLTSCDKREMNARLVKAVNKGDATRIKILLRLGADINARDADGDTALMLAATNGRIDIVRLLVNKGADVNAKGELGRTALMYGAFPIISRFGEQNWSDFEISEILLNKGAEVNAKDDSGATALIIVLLSGCNRPYGQVHSLTGLLIAHGADVNVMTNDGCTPLNHSSGAIRKLLEDAGATNWGEKCPLKICT